MKVIGTYISLRVRKVLVAAHYANLDFTHEEFFPPTASEDELKEYKKKNPNLKVPVLDTPDGPIYESNAILRHIARISPGKKLYGTTKFEEALVDQFLDWNATILEPAFFSYFVPYIGRMPFNQEAHAEAREKFCKALKILEDKLSTSKYLVGNNVTVADIAVVSLMWLGFKMVIDETTRNHFPHVSKYVEELANLEAFKKVYGRFSYPKTTLPVYTGYIPPLEEAKKAGFKKEDKPQPKKEAAPAPKKEAKKKKDEDEDDDDQPKEKKEKNPLDLLPPSSFNLFDYKTLFVNAPNKHEAFEVFLQQFDPEGYSCWHMEYDKAEGEGRVVFLTSNLMNGFLQRLETFRKYAFGVVGVYGEEPELQIRGAWVWRGTEIPFEIKDHPSGEWYKFRKLDVKNNEADRKLLEEYWCKMNEDEDIVEGLRARDVKYYK